MVLIADLFKEKKFPNWFTKHPVFNKITKISKVFPSIGLPNCEEGIKIDNVKPAIEAAKQLIASIDNNIAHRLETLPKFISCKPNMSEGRKTQGSKLIALLSAVSGIVHSKERGSFIVERNGRLTINLPLDINIDGDDRPAFREGQSLFRVYNKLNDLLEEGKFAKLERLEDIHAFKTFSTENVPNNQLKIVFSSDDIAGAWDIATMSMRGVKSCQSWDGEYKHCTIGSVIDPFVGIMYLTSGAKFSEKGSRMIRRCLVRFVVDSKTNKPYLLMDYMYPSADTRVVEQFKNFLKSKTGGKFNVQYAPNIEGDGLKNTYMPLTEIRKLLKKTSGHDDGSCEGLESIASYQDIRVVDKSSNKNDKNAILFEKNVKKKIGRFLKDFDKSFLEAIKETNIEAFPNSLKPTITKLKGDDKKEFNFSYLISDFARSIGNAFVKSVDKEAFTSSDLFAKRIYQSCFANRSKVLNEIKSKLVKDMNGKLQLKDKGKLKSEHIISMMNILLPKTNELMKPKLKELVSKCSSSKVSPLP